MIKIVVPQTGKETADVVEKIRPEYKAVLDSMFEQMIVLATALEKKEQLNPAQLSELACAVIDCDALVAQVKAFAVSVNAFMDMRETLKPVQAGESVSDSKLMAMKVQGMPS